MVVNSPLYSPLFFRKEAPPNQFFEQRDVGEPIGLRLLTETWADLPADPVEGVPADDVKLRMPATCAPAGPVTHEDDEAVGLKAPDGPAAS